MDFAGCERSWAKRIPTGTPGDTCFGLLRDQYVPFWCLVAVLTLALYLAREAVQRRSKRGKPALGAKPAPVQPGLLQRWLRKRKGTKSDLESGLLEGAENEESCVSPMLVATEQMEAVCAAAGISRGLEAAGLAGVLALRSRRRYGTPGVAVLGPAGKQPKTIDIEVCLPKMSFKELLKAADEALQQPAAADEAGADAPEVVLHWQREPAPGAAGTHWSLVRADEGKMELRGATTEEAASFKQLFEACAAEPDLDVWCAPLVPESTLAEVRSWGMPGSNFDDFRETGTGRLRTVPSILAELQVGPKADAVVGPGYCLSQEELRVRMMQVAVAIQAKVGTGSSRAVVVYMGRGEMIGPAILGVLQAGHHVVPVDVHWPLERAQTVAGDASAALALVEPTSAAAWASMGSQVPEALVVDQEFFTAQVGTDAKPQVPCLTDEDPAIILFTSGSTGRPKGIILSHGYVTALAAGRGECLKMSEQTRTLAYHSPTWMPFIDYFFGPLLRGGCCLFLAEQSSHAVHPDDLRSFAVGNGATIIGFVPAVLDIFLEEGFPKTASRICVGGAAVPAELCARVVAALPTNPDGSPGVLYTGYHGTEQGDVTQVRLSAEEDVQRFRTAKGVMGAGRPHAAQRCMLVDQGLRPVGVGAIGEICASGPGLASGYLNMPEKTAETFFAYEAMDGARTMRTADLGLWTAAGNLEVVGRRDAMVKVRGARVELGEVEAAVQSHPEVREVVVVVSDDRLVAYVSPAVPADLRNHCKAKLVAYMVPHVFEGLEELPRLANGKVNKKGLPAPTVSADGAETVMELDSLGKMRKITRMSASEDRILDNVRAMLIAVVIQSHATPLLPQFGAGMLNVASQPIGATWTPWQFFLLNLSRSGGWPSLAFLAGFDETRGDEAYALTYRELLFFGLWLVCGLNWTMWFLPAFVYMRVIFVAAKVAGLERTHMALASSIWLVLPSFVDFYTGWSGDPKAQCPSECVCPFMDYPWTEDIAYTSLGWWNGAGGPANSFLGRGLFFIPCYWLGFYHGRRVIPFLTRLTDEPNWLKRVAVAAAVAVLYTITFTAGQPVVDGFNDSCGAFWQDGSFVWMQVAKNIAFYLQVLWASVLYCVFVAAIMPVHMKYLSKVCFLALVCSPFTPCLLNFAEMALYIRQVLTPVAPAISPAVELLWVFSIPFLYMLVAGAICATALLSIVQVMAKINRQGPKQRSILMATFALGMVFLTAAVRPAWATQSSSVAAGH
uniref:AMP-dependent synthetase/ligase domain-containing protein n=1 Tax=Alexandrium monilatum TaxID=311494 RepID=A0A7S4Q4W0_9DINO|mmetsp:Transcript_61037/g.189233  ORF Transcript_61037/g.189233 Transcript_61037/m.189233 type:complete len:1239 (-) Transcript_61037:82-3798(-)